MSLAARLSWFFLVALALVLAGFSITLYLFASSHFQRDLDERSGDRVDILSASADVDEDEVEWKPTARPPATTDSTGEDPVRWVVSDGRSKVLEVYWKDLGNADIGQIVSLAPDVGHIHESFVDRGGRHWRLAVRRFQPGSLLSSLPDHHGHRGKRVRPLSSLPHAAVLVAANRRSSWRRGTF